MLVRYIITSQKKESSLLAKVGCSLFYMEAHDLYKALAFYIILCIRGSNPDYTQRTTAKIQNNQLQVTRTALSTLYITPTFRHFTSVANPGCSNCCLNSTTLQASDLRRRSITEIREKDLALLSAATSRKLHAAFCTQWQKGDEYTFEGGGAATCRGSAIQAV